MSFESPAFHGQTAHPQQFREIVTTLRLNVSEEDADRMGYPCNVGNDSFSVRPDPTRASARPAPRVPTSIAHLPSVRHQSQQ
jgi:hypothetical protein